MAHKKRKRYNKGNRLDMRQGGRVKMARGSQAEEKMLEDEIQQVSVQPTKKRPTGVSITPPSPEQQPMPDSNQPVSGFDTMPVDTTPAPLGDPRVPTTGGKKGVDAPRTPEELERLEQLSYVAGRTPTTSQQQQQPQAQVEAGDIQTEMTPEQRRAAQAALRAEDLGRGLGMPGSAYTLPVDEQPPVESVDPAYAQRETEEQRRTREIVQEAAEGKMPVAALTPDAVQAGFERDAQGNLILDEQGNPIPLAEAEVQEMAELTDAQAGVVEMPTAEEVTGAETTAVGAPETIQAARYDAQQVSEEVIIDPATGTLSPEARAELEEKAITYSASGVTFSQQQKDQGIIDRVVGTLDKEAMASAAKVAGTTLPKVLRAKKQLRNAGLSEEDITAIGNDPQDLEDRLMDFTEEQRGMVGNLPEEALVGKQIEGLLEGMENGEVPTWARPAVSAVNQMLAARGMSVSTVGRDALFNSIIQAAMPIAQNNAQTIKESAMQQTTIEAQAEQMNAQMRQQTAIRNADRVFNLNMAQFNADQQRELANKKFLQTVSMTEVSNEQQAVIQNAVNQTQLDLANLNTQERLAVQNAQAFLNMDMANLNNDQQARMVKAQQEQQRLLSNQAAANASAQFNATSENQTNQFMSNLATQIELNNAQRSDAISQFNAAQANAAEARRVGIEADINKTNATLFTQIEQFNAQQEFNRNQFNTQNAMIIEQSNVEWRRKSNTINTAAQNAINQQNAQNAFGLSTQAMSFLWQEMRDQATYIFQASENQANRKAQLMATALQNEAAAEKGFGSYNAVSGLISNFFGLSRTGDD